VANVSPSAHSIYGSIFNAKYGLFGRLWEETPRSTPMDEDHFLAAVRYVEQNPVRAGMVVRRRVPVVERSFPLRLGFFG